MQSAVHNYSLAYTKCLEEETNNPGVVQDIILKTPLAFSFEEFSFAAVKYFAPAIHALGLRHENPCTFITPASNPPPEVRVLANIVDPGDVCNEESICSFPSGLCKFCFYNLYPFGSAFGVNTAEDFQALLETSFQHTRRIVSREAFDTELAELWKFQVRMAVGTLTQDCCICE